MVQQNVMVSYDLICFKNDSLLVQASLNVLDVQIILKLHWSCAGNI